ncbi:MULTISPECIES: nickel pincer cofactor biosynthesis protein LarB [unclassified Cyanobium]|uniref:nickel pincer cofactor biosynthesis protein LarB n=1 Tax=unclassified Cyanobium TaxID=2627006 RepID=UPI0037C1458C|nr:nickel pincer cofactor biosynthesis protein LarB [Cyanobium sp. Cruz-8H5]MCP9864758.1 nickel pincer cofactor biosynthesis protein LarB [Cyanobium sp. Cruz-8D1]
MGGPDPGRGCRGAAVSEDVRLDLGRRQRLGMVEAVWGEHKSADQITAVLLGLRQAGELALVTRVSAEKAAAVERQLADQLGSDGDVPLPKHHPLARCLTWPTPPPADPAFGRVAVLSGGSSDLAVASEARLALACHGVASDLVLDVGVAGLHRLLAELEGLRRAKVLIACAGMEGALPTVLAGLLPQPVIGVPVAVGYGVSAGGQAALMGMLASCAPGLTVVNIDNGYGAAMAALRILQLGRAD